MSRSPGASAIFLALAVTGAQAQQTKPFSGTGASSAVAAGACTQLMSQNQPCTKENIQRVIDSLNAAKPQP